MSDLVTRSRIGITLNKEILEKFKELSDTTRIPMSKLLDEAVADLLEKYSPAE